jgi:hypothetical protein
MGWFEAMRRALVTGVLLGSGMAVGSIALFVAMESKSRHFQLAPKQLALGLVFGLVMGVFSGPVVMPQLLLRGRPRPYPYAFLVVSTLMSALIWLLVGLFAVVYTYTTVRRGHTQALAELGRVLEDLASEEVLAMILRRLAPVGMAFSTSALLSELRCRTSVRSVGCTLVAVPLAYFVEGEGRGSRHSPELFFTVASALNLAVLLPQAVALAERLDLRLERRLRGLGHP